MEDDLNAIVPIIITGGRGFMDWRAVHKLLYELLYDHGDKLRIAVGDCPSGVDAWVAQWLAKHPSVSHKVYKADWYRYGPKAGPFRNREMIETEKPKAVFAFPGGKGTENCKAIAKAKKISVVDVCSDK